MTCARGPRLLTPAALLLALVAGCSDGGDAPASAAARPNVLVLVLDTTRADRCSVNGYGRPTTPRISAFARGAVTFRNAWSPAPWTAPSHASLFTGLLPERHGLVAGVRLHLPPEATTLAERFRAAGYATAGYSNAPPVSAEFGLAQGFDEFVPMFLGREAVYPTARETHRLAADWALGARRRGQPFFLFVNDFESHLPYTPVASIEERFVAADTPRPAVAAARQIEHPTPLGHNLGVSRLQPQTLRLLSDLYDAEIATLDAEVGDLLDRFEAAGALDDTIVVIVGDHGENLGEHGLVDHMFSVHRTLLHVPLVVRVPPRFDARLSDGRAVDDVVRLEDVAPTLLEACGLEVPSGLDGVSLLGDVEGRVARGGAGRPVTLFGDARRSFAGCDLSKVDRTLRSVFDGRYHLIHGSDGTRQLYDVPADPGEIEDLAVKLPEEVERLEAMLGVR